MQAMKLKQVRRARRKIGIRKRVSGTAQQPRLSVYRSVKHLYAQLIDDTTGRTLAAASTVQEKLDTSNKTAAAEVGKKLAERAKAAGITRASFDRNGFKFHGRIKALADAAREAGLKV